MRKNSFQAVYTSLTKLSSNKGGWSIGEMIIVIVIMLGLGIMLYTSWNSETGKDPQRIKAITTMKGKIEAARDQKLNGEVPSTNAQSEGFPAECRTNSYKAIVDACLTKVLSTTFKKDSQDYQLVLTDPSQGKQVSGETFKYYYCPSTNPDRVGFRVLALAGDQDRKGLVGKDGSLTPAEGKGYLKVDSGTITSADVAVCYE